MSDHFSFFNSHERPSYSPLQHFSRPEYGVGRQSRPGAVQSMPPGVLAALVLMAFMFAAGFYGAVLLFADQPEQPPTVVVCPAPGTPNVAIWPAECPREVRR